MKRPKNKAATRLPVDPAKWGVHDNTYSSPPDYYYDIAYDCADCGTACCWTANEQKHWYEVQEKSINAFATRCRLCRAHRSALAEDQKRHMKQCAGQPRQPEKE